MINSTVFYILTVQVNKFIVIAYFTLKLETREVQVAFEVSAYTCTKSPDAKANDSVLVAGVPLLLVLNVHNATPFL